MRGTFTMALMLAGVLALPASSAAQTGVFVTPFVGISAPRYGIAIGSTLRGIFGVEGELAYTPDFFREDARVTDSRVFTFMGNFLMSPALGAFHPYMTMGIGLIRQEKSLKMSGVLTNISSNDFGINGGGGTRFMMSEHLGVRGDIRYFKVRKIGGLGFWRGYVGLNLTW